MNRLFVSVISAGRPGNVARISQMVPGAVWFVPEEQSHEYRIAGAQVVPVTGVLPMKGVQLNRALDEGFSNGRMVVTLDDDIIKVISKDTRAVVSVEEALTSMAAALQSSDFSLGGPYSGTNTSWAPGRVKWGRVPGAMMLHKRSDLRFDVNNVGAEDLDYNIQHHLRFGGVELCGEFCLANEWSSNAGGYQSFRTPQNMAQVTQLMHRKWMHRKWSQYGASFKLATTKNGVSYRVPWKNLTEVKNANP